MDVATVKVTNGISSPFPNRAGVRATSRVPCILIARDTGSTPIESPPLYSERSMDRMKGMMIEDRSFAITVRTRAIGMNEIQVRSFEITVRRQATETNEIRVRSFVTTERTVAIKLTPIGVKTFATTAIGINGDHRCCEHST